MELLRYINVVRDSDSGRIANLFSHGGLRFDRLFAQVFGLEKSQPVSVKTRTSEIRQDIFFVPMLPSSIFLYKGHITDSLYAHQFEEGDTIVFMTREEGLTNEIFLSRVKTSYKLHRASLFVGGIPSSNLDDYMEGLDKIEEAYHHRSLVQPLLFDQEEEFVWT